MANLKVGLNLKEGSSINPISGVSTVHSGIMGTFERGPLNIATLVTSFAQFVRIFGSKPAANSTSWYAVKAFFQNAGSSQLWIVRVASAAANKATTTLQDRQGVPANTLRVDALSEGAWGNNLSVAIEDNSILTTTLAADADAGATSAVLTSIGGLEVGSDIELDNGVNQEQVRIIQIDQAAKTVHWTGGLTNSYTATDTVKSLEFALKVYDRNTLVETWQGLSMNDDVTLFCEKKINGASAYIAVTDLKGTDTDFEDLPAVTATPDDLAAGADGLSDIDADDYKGVEASKTGKFAFDAVPELFRFCCPGPLLTDADQDAAHAGLVQDLLSYADTRVTLQYYAEPRAAKTVTEVGTFAAGFEGRRLALFWPWLKVSENNLTVTLPPSAFAMGVAVAKDTVYNGPHRAIGNKKVAYAIGLQYEVNTTEHNTLNDAGVNVILRQSGRGILVFGDVTRSAETRWKFLHVSEIWNYIGRSLEQATAGIIYEPNNTDTWKATVRRVETFLSNEQRKGALENTADPTAPAYLVQMDSVNNPQDQVAQGIATLYIEFIPVGAIEKLVVELTSSPTGLSITNAA